MGFTKIRLALGSTAWWPVFLRNPIALASVGYSPRLNFRKRAWSLLIDIPQCSLNLSKDEVSLENFVAMEHDNKEVEWSLNKAQLYWKKDTFDTKLPKTRSLFSTLHTVCLWAQYVIDDGNLPNFITMEHTTTYNMEDGVEIQKARAQEIEYCIFPQMCFL